MAKFQGKFRKSEWYDDDEYQNRGKKNKKNVIKEKRKQRFEERYAYEEEFKSDENRH